MIQEVLDRASPPYSAVCLVFATFPNGATLRGSAVIVGPNDVLTALHLVYEEQFGGWATHVSVIPGADTSPFDAPFGTFSDVGSIVGRRPDWDVDGDGLVSPYEAQYDLALIGFRSAIGDAAGWLSPIAKPGDFDAVVAGYPASTPPGSGVGLMENAVVASSSTPYGVYDVAYSLGAGSSGGPLLWMSGGAAYVAGIASSASFDDARSTYAALFGEGTWEWLTQAAAANDSLMTALPVDIAGTGANDSIDGNSLSNRIDAGAGDDVLRGRAGNDTLTGGEGIDCAIYAGARGEYSVFRSGADWNVADSVFARDGIDTLDGVERLRFGDGWLALDLDANAGVVARLVGAVFGRETVGARPDYVGIGLKLIDGGMSERDLAQRAIDARFGGAPAYAELVDTLYFDATGHAPAAAIEAQYLAMLDAATALPVDLALLAAHSDAIAARIGLTGLAAAGLAYQAAA